MTYPRTSPVASSLEKLDPTWDERFGMRVPLRFRGIEEEKAQFGDLAVSDLSALPKLGLKGAGALAWLSEAGIPVPDGIYDWNRMEGDGLVLRIDRNEVFLEEGSRGAVVGRLAARPGLGTTELVQRVEHQEAGFLLSGGRAWEVLRQVCSYDFRDASETVVMTRAAAVSCMVLPGRVAGVPVYRIWCVPSYGVYLWDNLLQIVSGLGGSAVGLACFCD
jgi:glycine cleavage system aminomethyltransferase T